MLNKENVKIKHILGSFRDELDFPTHEDFLYLVQNWYWVEGGHNFIHVYRGIEETGNVIFPDSVLKEKLNGNLEQYADLIHKLLKEGKIKVFKDTKFTTYYSLIN
jgi:hypothetical protein